MDTTPVVGDVIQFQKKYQVTCTTLHKTVTVGSKTKWLVIERSRYPQLGDSIKAVRIKDNYDPKSPVIEFYINGDPETIKQVNNIYLKWITRYVQYFKKS